MRVTFEKVGESWLEVKRRIVKHSTFCAYQLIFHTHLLPLFGQSFHITETEAQKMVFSKLSSGLAKKTVRDILAVLKSMVKYGAKYKGWSTEDWSIEYPRDTEGKVLPVLSKGDHRKLMDHLIREPTARNIGILLSLFTGMRIGEVCALKWEDVDFKNRTLTVRSTTGRVYDYEKKKTARVYSSPKTRTSNREIPIVKELMTALRTVRKRRGYCLYVVGQGDKAQEPRSYRDYFTRLIARLGIQKIVFHGLRHTFATRCVESQCDYKTLSAILGHSNVSTTLNLYVHPDLEQKKRCMEKLSKYILK